MNAQGAMLKDRLRKYEEQLRGLKSFIEELKDVTAAHGTETESFEEDMEEARHNITFYEAEIARIKKEMEQFPEDDYTQTKTSGLVPQTAKQGLGYLILASVSFVAGALLASNLMSQGADKSEREE